MADKYKPMYSQTLSKQYDPRYVVVDTETGEILDDAQGYGYKTAQNAMRAWAYKNRTPAQKKKQENAKEAVRKFCKEHKSFVRGLEADAFYMLKDHEKLDTKYVAVQLRGAGYKDLPFTAAEFLKYW